ncbi:MAG TPA: RidA family protein [Candidatus Acidoferrales bacterium]|nr:RidA family protein [Candidatus Acidoferrales bacterium]
MKLRTASFAAFLLLTACSISADADRKYVVLPRPAEFKGVPFSDGVLVGDVLYVGEHVGIDPKTGKAGITAEEDAKFAMDGVQQTLEAAGMTMDDLVSVQIFCTSATDYAVFNSVYRKYFHGDYPARTFVQAGKILGDSRFEVQGIAVRRTK